MSPEKLPPFEDLKVMMPYLEEALGVIMVPTLGVPIHPNPFSYLYPHVKTVFDSYRDIIRTYADEVREYIFSPKLASIPNEKADDVTPYWGNAYFHPGDARLAYAVIARCRPRRIIEIGCGNSTKFMRRAITDYAIKSEIICIDPQPREDISGIADKFHQASLPTVTVDIFNQLQSGDVLFIDGSHLVMNGSDCVQFFLNILPMLPKGIWVHLHDIFLPYDYPYQLFLDIKSNEQYMLAMLFLHSKEWIPVLPIYYGYQEGILPHGGGSLWMRKL